LFWLRASLIVKICEGVDVSAVDGNGLAGQAYHTVEVDHWARSFVMHPRGILESNGIPPLGRAEPNSQQSLADQHAVPTLIRRIQSLAGEGAAMAAIRALRSIRNQGRQARRWIHFATAIDRELMTALRTGHELVEATDRFRHAARRDDERLGDGTPEGD